MPQEAWSAKRERQYEHIEEGLEKRGTPKRKAKEIAARTVNKERARAGEAKESSRLSREDISSGRRGGLRSGTDRPKGRTREQLYNEVAKLPTSDGAYVDVAEGVRIGLVAAPTDVDYDLDHVALYASDPDEAAQSYAELGFTGADAGPDGIRRVEVGGAFVELHPGDPG